MLSKNTKQGTRELVGSIKGQTIKFNEYLKQLTVEFENVLIYSISFQFNFASDE